MCQELWRVIHNSSSNVISVWTGERGWISLAWAGRNNFLEKKGSLMKLEMGIISTDGDL